MANILVVDDETGIRELLAEILYDEGHIVMLAENAAQAREARDLARPDLVLLDIWMPDTDGVTLLKEWALSGQLNMPVVMMSGHASIETAVEATRIGALDFLEKPITLQKLLHTVKQGLLRSAMVTNTVPLSTDTPTQATPSQTNTNIDAINQSVSPPPFDEPTLKLSKLNLDVSLREARDEFERVYFNYHLSKESSNITRVAEHTGLERTHLYRKLKQLNIPIIKPSKIIKPTSL